MGLSFTMNVSDLLYDINENILQDELKHKV